MKIRVDHATHYTYDAPVRHSAQYLRLVHGDIEEIFVGGLHEYLIDFLTDVNELGQRIQRAYLVTL